MTPTQPDITNDKTIILHAAADAAQMDKQGNLHHVLEPFCTPGGDGAVVRSWTLVTCDRCLSKRTETMTALEERNL